MAGARRPSCALKYPCVSTSNLHFMGIADACVKARSAPHIIGLRPVIRERMFCHCVTYLMYATPQTHQTCPPEQQCRACAQLQDGRTIRDMQTRICASAARNHHLRYPLRLCQFTLDSNSQVHALTVAADGPSWTNSVS